MIPRGRRHCRRRRRRRSARYSCGCLLCGGGQENGDRHGPVVRHHHRVRSLTRAGCATRSRQLQSTAFSTAPAPPRRQPLQPRQTRRALRCARHPGRPDRAQQGDQAAGIALDQRVAASHAPRILRRMAPLHHEAASSWIKPPHPAPAAPLLHEAPHRPRPRDAMACSAGLTSVITSGTTPTVPASRRPGHAPRRTGRRKGQHRRNRDNENRSPDPRARGKSPMRVHPPYK